jgi:hypothetical protein
MSQKFFYQMDGAGDAASDRRYRASWTCCHFDNDCDSNAKASPLAYSGGVEAASTATSAAAFSRTVLARCIALGLVSFAFVAGHTVRAWPSRDSFAQRNRGAGYAVAGSFPA